MKSLFIPILVLAAVLAAALWTGNYISGETARWSDTLRQADTLAAQERWEEAENAIQQAYDDWNSRQTFLHIVMEHEELDEAESLFAAAFAACSLRDAPDFQATLAQLISQMSLLAETQQVSIKNIL